MKLDEDYFYSSFFFYQILNPTIRSFKMFYDFFYITRKNFKYIYKPLETKNFYKFLFNNNRFLALRFFIYFNYIDNNLNCIFLKHKVNININENDLNTFRINSSYLEVIEDDFNWNTLNNPNI
jgi:hypothetical protein